MKDGTAIGLGCVFILLIGALCTLISTSIIYFGFNLVISPIFGLNEITFFQALLLAALISFIGGCFRATVSTESS